MPYYVIDNFQRGLDLRKSIEVAPPGSLRVLRNAFINSGGEVEKRKAFVRNEVLTAYGQGNAFKGKIVGPMQIPAYTNMAYFRHHTSAMPEAGFTVGSGLGGSSYSSYTEDGVGRQTYRFWANRVENEQSIVRHALMHNSSVSEFGAGDFPGFSVDDFAGQVYAVDASYDSNNRKPIYHHLQQYILIDTGEPFKFAAGSGKLDRSQQITLQNKSFTVSDDILYSSAVGDPLNFEDAGSGFLKISSQGISIGRAVALAIYFGQLTIFGPRGAQFYEVDPDFALTQYLRTVETDIFASRSVIGYADGDLIYLSRTGIRSLQARDSSNFAITNDVGSPIDALIKDEIAYDPDVVEAAGAASTLPVSDFYYLAKSVIYPMTGDYWLFLKDKIYVLSRHPAADVLAWSTFDLPVPDDEHIGIYTGPIKSRWCGDACRIGDTITFRNFADEMFVYGGPSGNEYDESEAEVITPFMDMERPGDNKYYTGIDLVCEGKWDVEIALDPVADGEELVWRKVAEVDGRTRRQTRIYFQAQGTQIALRMTSRTPRAARLSQVAIYYEMGGQK